MTRRSLAVMFGLLGCGNLREVSPDAASPDAAGRGCEVDCVDDFGTPIETTFIVEPRCTTLRVQIWGAGGGAGDGNTRAGAGGYVDGELTFEPGDPLLVVVGGAGASATATTPGSGGLPGGGSGGTGSGRAGGGGGGFSGIFRAAKMPQTAIAIAGAGAGSGGGTGAEVFAGAGGGQVGQGGGNDAGVAPGTQGSGFDFFAGGAAVGVVQVDGGGGGGAGWFGGFGGGSAQEDGYGGGGGSGYVDDGLALVLEGGLGRLPGGVDAPERNGAGEPGADGRVVITCLGQN